MLLGFDMAYLLNASSALSFARQGRNHYTFIGYPLHSIPHSFLPRLPSQPLSAVEANEALHLEVSFLFVLLLVGQSAGEGGMMHVSR